MGTRDQWGRNGDAHKFINIYLSKSVNPLIPAFALSLFPPSRIPDIVSAQSLPHPQTDSTPYVHPARSIPLFQER